MTKMVHILFRIKDKTVLLLVISVLFLGSFSAFGYVMPAEQILEFMAENFSGLRTVKLVQNTIQTANGYEKEFTEQLWLESPDRYSTKSLERQAEEDNIVPDLLYRQLFVANDREKIERILLPLGIDLTKTSLTRIDGDISYRIGDKEPDSPQLIIEKKRFIPLLLIYRVPDRNKNELITVRFNDYKRRNKVWYPFEITYEEGVNLIEKYTIKTFEVNIPIEASTLNSFPEYELPEVPESETAISDSEAPYIDKERLRNVIKAFEEQYQ